MPILVAVFLCGFCNGVFLIASACKNKRIALIKHILRQRLNTIYHCEGGGLIIFVCHNYICAVVELIGITPMSEDISFLRSRRGNGNNIICTVPTRTVGLAVSPLTSYDINAEIRNIAVYISGSKSYTLIIVVYRYGNCF